MRWLVLVISLVSVAACGKANEEDCRKAILNVQKIRGFENDRNAPDVESRVRQCRAGGKKQTIDCLIKATTPAELDSCDPKAK
jgi:hypothetical protein